MKRTTPEQKARDLLERMGVNYAQSFSAGDVVELANLIGRDSHRGTDLRLARITPESSGEVATLKNAKIVITTPYSTELSITIKTEDGQLIQDLGKVFSEKRKTVTIDGLTLLCTSRGPA